MKTENTKTLVSLNSLSKIFQTDDLETHALSDINMEVKQGEYIAISGPSGCGKSTMLSILGLLDTPSKGEYILSGHNVTALNKDERAAIRNEKIGFIFQAFNLISDLTVEENVALPLSYRSDLTSAEIKTLVANALQEVDMQHRSDHFPSQLSGGQQQRVAIARAIAGKPDVILADEPTGNLDSKNASAVMELLDKLHAAGATICMVTHDPRSASRADRTIEIFDGKLVADVRSEATNAVAI